MTKEEARPNESAVGPGVGWPAPQCPRLSFREGRVLTRISELSKKAPQSPGGLPPSLQGKAVLSTSQEETWSDVVVVR